MEVAVYGSQYGGAFLPRDAAACTQLPLLAGAGANDSGYSGVRVINA